MRQLLSKHIFHRIKHHHFISLIIFGIGLFIILYFLYRAIVLIPQTFRQHFSYNQYASAINYGEGEQISEALFLPQDTIKKVTLSAYSQKYYYFTFHNKKCLRIITESSPVKTCFYGDNGKALVVSQKNHGYIFSNLPKSNSLAGSRIFIKFKNNTSKTCTIKILLCRISEKNNKTIHDTTPKPQKRNSSKTAKKEAQGKENRTQRIETQNKLKQNNTKTPKQKAQSAQNKAQVPKRKTQSAQNTIQASKGKAQSTQNTSQRPEDKKESTQNTSQGPKGKTQPAQNKAKMSSNTMQKNNILVKPHFMRLTIGSSKSLTLQDTNSSIFLSDCIHFLTEPSLVTISNNTITGEKEGVTLLYFRKNSYSSWNSCLIRVIN